MLRSPAACALTAPVVVLAASTLALAAPPTSAPASATASKGFVRVDGTRLVIDGKPFHFVGANLNVMHGRTARDAAPKTIAAAAKDGLKVGRLWALGEGLGGAPAWKARDYLFRRGPTGWQEAGFRQLDRVIAEAGKRGLRLIITLSNRWADYGGIPMYLRWAGDFESEAYGYTDRFFTNPQVKRWFAEHLRRVVGRVNSVTGVAYRDDPTIMTWELQNEMTGTPEAAPARRAWFVEMARLVRSMAPNQMVVPGLIGYNLRLERKHWIAMCRLPEVSYCDQHIYPEQHLRSRTWRDLKRYIDDRVQLAHFVVGKPIVFGEYGFSDRGSQRRRAQLHGRFLRRLFFDGGSGGLVWIYQPTLSWKRRYGVLVDKRRYRPLRRELAAVAREVAARVPVGRNSALGPAVGEQPIAPTHVTMVRQRAPHRRWRRVVGGARLELAVDRFYRAHFEEAGSWDGGVLVHTYGRRTGWIEYRFIGSRRRPRRLTIRARLSSEFPGSVGPRDGLSRVKVLLDGQQLAIVEAPTDDGVGGWRTVSVDVASAPGLLARFARRTHVLRLAVEDGPKANGVAIYGRETPINREPVEAPGPLTLDVSYGD